MQQSLRMLAAVALAAVLLAACQGSGGVSAPANGEGGVFFISPHDGDVITGPEVKLVMGVKGKKVVPAGEIIPGTGHHHLIIDEEDTNGRGQTIGRAKRTIHYVNGETEAVIELPTGEHTLTLQFANGRHVSYGEAWRQTIHIMVK